MDAVTYVVVSGWVLMYFAPSIWFALSSAVALALLAVFLVHPGDTGVLEAALPLAPVVLAAIFAAWPLGIVFRRLKAWWRRKVAGA
jgi:hypothetical protein